MAYYIVKTQKIINLCAIPGVCLSFWQSSKRAKFILGLIRIQRKLFGVPYDAFNGKPQNGGYVHLGYHPDYKRSLSSHLVQSKYTYLHNFND